MLLPRAPYYSLSILHMREIEYEKTYLAKSLPKGLKNYVNFNVIDAYFPENRDVLAQLRVREKRWRFEITKKVPIWGDTVSAQVEETIPLNELEWKELQKASKKIVEKVRYKIDIDWREAEIDVFMWDLEWLVLIDFEFLTKEEMDEFKTPDCCLADVTEELFIAGSELAGRSYEDIKWHLDRYHYKKLSLTESSYWNEMHRLSIKGLIKKDDKILLVQNKAWDWWFPGWGVHVEEDLWLAIEREIMEEIWVWVKNYDESPMFACKSANRLWMTVLNLYYEVELNSFDFKFEEEIALARFFTLDEAFDLWMWWNSKQFIDYLKTLN